MSDIDWLVISYYMRANLYECCGLFAAFCQFDVVKHRCKTLSSLLLSRSKTIPWFNKRSIVNYFLWNEMMCSLCIFLPSTNCLLFCLLSVKFIFFLFVTVRWSSSEFISTKLTKLGQRTLKVSKKCLTTPGSEEKLDSNFELQEKGLHLMSKGKMAIVLFVNDSEKHGRCSVPELVDSESAGNSTSFLQTLLSDDRISLKVKCYFKFQLTLNATSICCGEDEAMLFSESFYQMVWWICLLTAERRPCFSASYYGFPSSWSPLSGESIFKSWSLCFWPQKG